MRPLLLSFLLISLLSLPAFAEDEGTVQTAPLWVDVGLDPGHSRVDVGATGGGLSEYKVTLAIANRVRELLTERGLSVAVSREDSSSLTDFSSPDPTDAVRVEQEARIAVVGSARLYVSIHLNGFPDARVRGTEVYYNGDNFGDESRSAATSIHGRLLEAVQGEGYDIPDRGVREDLSAGKPYGHFFSLRGPMPSVLVESMFLTNPTEAALLGEDSMREAIAKGIAGGILDYLSPGLTPWTSDYAASGTSDQ